MRDRDKERDQRHHDCGMNTNLRERPRVLGVTLSGSVRHISDAHKHLRGPIPYGVWRQAGKVVQPLPRQTDLSDFQAPTLSFFHPVCKHRPRPYLETKMAQLG